MVKPSTILVVDDEPHNVKLLDALLRANGYQVVTAATGEEALQRVAASAPDLILLDVMMPGLDGFEATRRLRANPTTRLIPIVLVTALKETEDRIRGIEAGCDDFLSKPVDKHELLARVKTLLTLSYYRSLLDEREKFEAVMQQAGDGIVVFDASWRLIRLNATAAMLLEVDPNAPPADWFAHLAQRFTPPSASELRQQLMTTSLAFDLARAETEATRALILAVRSHVARDPAGAISSIVWTLHDASEERREDWMKRDFLSLISHKLRTPVAVITNNAALLRDELAGALTPEQRPVIEGILSKADELDRLIGKLLGFTSVYSQTVERPADAIDVSREVPSLAAAAVKRLRRKPVAWRLQGADGRAPVRMHKTHLELILGNLIENAVVCNDKPSVELVVSVAPGATHVEVSVTDNGPGIPPEERERIFEPFYQVEKDFTGNVEGPGLGLALVKRLVGAYGGSLRVQSQLGRGSTFTISLPLHPASSVSGRITP